MVWPKFLNIPFGISTWITHRSVITLHDIASCCNIAYIDVPIPSDYGLPYQDLELETSDKVKLRCYLLPQKKMLSNTHVEAARLPYEEYGTDDEVDLFHKVAPFRQ